MHLSDAPAVDARPALVHERRDLLELLASLGPDEWSAPTAVPGWSVKDLALHLLDDDLGWLSRGRDADPSGLLDEGDQAGFVTALAAKNQRWIDCARGLSPRVVVDLLGWSGAQMDEYYGSMDLDGDGAVSWAATDAVPAWFDVCQDFTERWVHQMQIREAVGRIEDHRERYLPLVLRTFVWAFPHQLRVEAAGGTTIALELGVGGSWTLTCEGGGTWRLDGGAPLEPDASAVFDGDAAWRSLTAAPVPAGGVRLDGPRAIVEPLLEVRGILA